MKNCLYLIVLTLCFSIARANDENVDDLIVSSYIETQDEKIKDFQGKEFQISFQKESILKKKVSMMVALKHLSESLVVKVYYLNKKISSHMDKMYLFFLVRHQMPT
ncbi:hypothetical protein FORC55_2799 [Vibrio cholerae]|nr:hypothetical protein FORC55_2799 [Vibrio cholerae]